MENLPETKPGNQRGVMHVMRSIWAVLAGYLTLAILVMLLLMIVLAIVPRWQASVSSDYLAANIMLSIISAMAGGWVCARLAPDRPLAHGLALGIISLVLGVLYALDTPLGAGRTAPPQWYGVLLALLALPSVLAGTMLRIRTAGRS